MAKTVELAFSLSRKVSDGNYGSIEFFAMEKVAIEEGVDNPNAVYEELRARVTDRVMHELNSRGICP